MRITAPRLKNLRSNPRHLPWHSLAFLRSRTDRLISVPPFNLIARRASSVILSGLVSVSRVMLMEKMTFVQFVPRNKSHNVSRYFFRAKITPVAAPHSAASTPIIDAEAFSRLSQSAACRSFSI
jgi:hypothetical protein